MERVIVVCGAGASSSFLAHWMRREAVARELAMTVVPESADGVASAVAPGDIVLVGHHLENSFAGILDAAARAGARALLLPALSPNAAGAAIALDVLELLPSGPAASASITSRPLESGAHHG